MMMLATHNHVAGATANKQGSAEGLVISASVDANANSEYLGSDDSISQSLPSGIFQLLMPAAQVVTSSGSSPKNESQQDTSVDCTSCTPAPLALPALPLALQGQTLDEQKLPTTVVPTTAVNLAATAALSPVVSSAVAATTPVASEISTAESHVTQIQKPVLLSLNSTTNEQASLTSAKPIQVDTTALMQQIQAQPQQMSPVFQLSTNQPSAATITSAPVQSQSAEWASMRIDTQAGKWGEQMMQVLHDRVTLQAQQNLQEAKIRLDPPELGKLDLMVRVEGDRLSVQINASATATREALMQVSERLRVELQQQNFVHVDVNVGADQGQQSHAEQTAADDEMTIFASRDFAPSETQSTPHYSEHWLNTQA